jgi:uncharacterized protein (TIGR00369 family)
MTLSDGDERPVHPIASGLRFLSGILESPRMTRKVGNIEFDIVEQSAEKVVGRMPVQPGILNPFGTVHAGAILWLADVCATVLAFGGAKVEPGQAGFPLAIHLVANLIGNQKEGMFEATSVFVRKGRRLSVVRTTVTARDGRLIADVTTSHIPAQ